MGMDGGSPWRYDLMQIGPNEGKQQTEVVGWHFFESTAILRV
jgi:hypothetical protein